MDNPAKLFIAAGVVLIVIGLVWMLGGKYIQLGRLPGDIVIERDNFKFYFPIVTCIVISVVVSLIFYIVRLFNK